MVAAEAKHRGRRLPQKGNRLRQLPLRDGSRIGTRPTLRVRHQRRRRTSWGQNKFTTLTGGTPRGCDPLGYHYVTQTRTNAMGSRTSPSQSGTRAHIPKGSSSRTWHQFTSRRLVHPLTPRNPASGTRQRFGNGHHQRLVGFAHGTRTGTCFNQDDIRQRRHRASHRTKSKPQTFVSPSFRKANHTPRDTRHHHSHPTIASVLGGLRRTRNPSGPVGTERVVIAALSLRIP